MATSRKRKLPLSLAEVATASKQAKIDWKQCYVREHLKNILQDVSFVQNDYKKHLEYHLDKLQRLAENDSAAHLKKLCDEACVYVSNELGDLNEKIDDFSRLSKCLTDEEEEEDEAGDGEKEEVAEGGEAMESIDAILKDLKELESDIDGFRGRKSDKRFLHLDEMLIRNQIKLDNVESNGNVAVRQARKKAIQFAQSCQKSLNSKAAM